jgi:hypothetical protein
MNIKFRLFRFLAISGLVVYGLYVSLGNMAIALNLSKPNSTASDSVTDWERRMKRVKNRLPEDVTVVGYVADWNLPGVETNPVDQDTEYVLSQYALAPVKVVPGLEAEWILGNFVTPDFQAWLDQSVPAHEMTKIGYGIYLIHRINP